MTPFVVMVRSELYGDSRAIVQRMSSDGIVVTLDYAPPVGTTLTVHFQLRHDISHDDHGVDELVARARVVASGIDTDNRPTVGLQFLEFIDQGAPAPERVH